MNLSHKKKIKILSTNHIIIGCKLNGVFGKFIIDTGASNSCVNSLSANKFNIKFKKSHEKAFSATSKINETFYSVNNLLEINKFKINDFKAILFNMSNINDLLKEKNIDEIDGIIGGDFLIEFKANIDYKNSILSLKL